MKKLLSLLSFAFFFFGVLGQTWTQKANFPGHIRDYDAGFTIGNYGYIGCGWDGSNYYNDFYKWNQTTNTWSTIASYPGAGYHLSPISFTIEGKGYVGLGWNGSGGSQDLWSYDSATNTWTQMASLPGPGRYDEAVFVLGHKAYIITGSQGGPPYLNDIWMYDAHTNTWTQKNNSPAGNVDGMVAFSVGGNGYIGGGWDGSMQHNQFWKYDSTSDAWTSVASIPFANGVSGDPRCFVIGNMAYVCTGTTNISTTIPVGYSYDPTTNTWTEFTNMGANGIERGYAVAFTIGNYGYIGTGIDSNGTYLNTFWQYYPCSDTLLGINEVASIDVMGIKIHPNPSNGFITISYNGLTGKKSELQITDITGRNVTMLSLMGSSGQVTEDESILENGMYFYRVISDEKIVSTGKLIISK